MKTCRLNTVSHLIWLWVSLLSCSMVSQAQEAGQHSPSSAHRAVTDWTVPSIEADILVDGELDEEAWARAYEVELSFITRPFENATPPVKTAARVFENGETLYIAFVAEDLEPEQIRAFYRDRDSVWEDDLVGIKLDTFGDSRLAYQFFVNPYGIQLDAIENEMTRSESDSWDAIWESAGKINADGYQVEIALPFRIMNFNDVNGAKRWRAEFVRFYPRENNLRLSNMPVDRNNSCTLCQMGDISGFESAKQGQNLAIVPYAVASGSRTRSPKTNRDWENTNDQEVGVDINWGITSDILLQATINPDFSQVEADAGQLDINNPFALFFPEQRPFFLENADFFSTQYDLVYTRNIGAPDAGAKVTGRIEDHTFGLLVANDIDTTFLVPGNLGSRVARLEQDSMNMAARYRYDVSDDLSFGAILTGRRADDYSNIVTGIDTRYQITPTDILRVQVLGSETEYPEDLFEEFCREDCESPSDLSESALRTRRDADFRGRTYRIDYRHEERDWFFLSNYLNTDEDFRADLGFQSRVDWERSVVGGGYVWWNEDAWWNRLEFSGDWDITHNANGDLIEREIQAQIEVNAAYQSFFQLQWLERDRVGLRQDRSRLNIVGNSTLFREKELSFYFEAQPTRSFYFENFVRVGDRIDFDNNRLGEQILVEPEFVLNLGKHARAEVAHSYNRIDVEDEMLFTANLTDVRLSYQFDAKQFLRIALIYSDVRRNPANYLFDVDAWERNLGSQVIYSYMVNPLTRFFFGYGDAAFADDELPGLTRDQQTLFMKFSYAWLN